MRREEKRRRGEGRECRGGEVKTYEVIDWKMLLEVLLDKAVSLSMDCIWQLS